MDRQGPGSIVRKILRSPSLNRRHKNKPVPLTERVTLERVLGFTIQNSAGLTLDKKSGIIAYPAGCALVLLNTKKNKQSHIFNSSKKAITSISFSPDGKYLVTGECGHLPNVRVWDVEEKTQLHEFKGHKFGINCVAFSPNMKYIISVGSQHDMMVSVWNWRSGVKFASNKISAKVNAVAFAEDGSYFVTVGVRHVKFWYLDQTKSRVKETVPLQGRSGILGDQRNNFFTDVACGKGKVSSSTFCITESGLLCEFNEKRLLDKWVELRTKTATCISSGSDYLLIGCGGGVVRIFNPVSLHYLTSLPKPHYIGIDVASGLDPSRLIAQDKSVTYPDTLALSYDDKNKKVVCVYNDHSMYVWNVKDPKKVGKVNSYLYHSQCIWGLEIFPEFDDPKNQTLPPGSFLTCSGDDTIRIWNIDQNMSNEGHLKRNIFSNDLLKILYTDPEYNFICNVDYNPSGGTDKTDNGFDGKNGVRSIKVSPDGKYLASGDRAGNVRIHNLYHMSELGLIEAHDAEVLCLEYYYSNKDGSKYLATSSRDRLVHVFDVNKDYSLLQTLDDHSSSITAVKFTDVDGELQMLSCGADKSLLFRTAQKAEGDKVQFTLRHHLVGKTTLYDMIVDPTNRFVATACQDRNVRVYNIKTGKQKKCYKGSTAEDGTLLKCQLDPSGSYLATSSSDKNLSIIDFFTGECMSVMFGHSEVAPALKFTNDMRHLISVSGDGCIFIWKLSQEIVLQMRQRKNTIGSCASNDILDKMKATVNRRRTFNTISDSTPQISVQSDYRNTGNWDSPDVVPIQEEPYKFNVGQLPSWAKKQVADNDWSVSDNFGSPQTAKGCWAKNIDEDFVIKSYQDISTLSVEPIMIVDDDGQNQDDDDDDGFYPIGQDGNTSGNSEVPSWKLVHSQSLDEPLRHLSVHSDERSETDEDEEEKEEDSSSDDNVYYPQRDRESTCESTFNIYAMDSDELRLGKKRVSQGHAAATDDSQDQETDTTEPLSDDEFSEFASPMTSNANTPIDIDISREEYVKQTFEDLNNEEFSENQEEAITQGFFLCPRGNSHRQSISSKFLTNAQQVQLQKRAKQVQKEEKVQKKENSPSRSLSGSPKSNMRKSWSVSDLSVQQGSRHSSPEVEPVTVPENQLKGKKIHRSQTLAATSRNRLTKKATESTPKWSTLPAKTVKSSKASATSKSHDPSKSGSTSATSSPNPSPVKKRFNRTPVSHSLYVSQPNLDDQPISDSETITNISARSVPDIINEIQNVAAEQRGRLPSLEDHQDQKAKKQIPVGISFAKNYSKTIDKSDAPLSSAVSSRNEGFMKKAAVSKSKLFGKPTTVTRPKDLLFTSSGEHEHEPEKITFTDTISQSLPTIAHIPGITSRESSSGISVRAVSPVEVPVKDNCSNPEPFNRQTSVPYSLQTSTVLTAINSPATSYAHSNTCASVTTTNANGSVVSSVSNRTFNTNSVPSPGTSPVRSVSPSVIGAVKKTDNQSKVQYQANALRRLSSSNAATATTYTTTNGSPINGRTAVTPDRSRLALPLTNNELTSSGEYDAGYTGSISDPIDTCTQTVTDLKRAALKATNMYEKLLRGKTNSPTDKSAQMMTMLQEAFGEVATLLATKDYVSTNAQTKDVTSQTLFTGPMPSVQLDDRMHVVMENMLHQYSSDLAHRFISLVEDKLEYQEPIVQPETKRTKCTLETGL